jgi:hypothetical protein
LCTTVRQNSQITRLAGTWSNISYITIKALSVNTPTFTSTSVTAIGNEAITLVDENKKKVSLINFLRKKGDLKFERKSTAWLMKEWEKTHTQFTLRHL